MVGENGHGISGWSPGSGLPEWEEGSTGQPVTAFECPFFREFRWYRGIIRPELVLVQDVFYCIRFLSCGLLKKKDRFPLRMKL